MELINSAAGLKQQQADLQHRFENCEIILQKAGAGDAWMHQLLLDKRLALPTGNAAMINLEIDTVHRRSNVEASLVARALPCMPLVHLC